MSGAGRPCRWERTLSVVSAEVAPPPGCSPHPAHAGRRRRNAAQIRQPGLHVVPVRVAGLRGRLRRGLSRVPESPTGTASCVEYTYKQAISILRSEASHCTIQKKLSSRLSHPEPNLFTEKMYFRAEHRPFLYCWHSLAHGPFAGSPCHGTTNEKEPRTPRRFQPSLRADTA